ncbi:MAG TPA: RdgB/HAM1 family non-canonical purine NTP pyrophosphatase [bacterium]|jgi:XTP/dITP diphosphohydrolase
MTEKILIATTNLGKLKEMKELLKDLDVECIFLRQVEAFQGPEGVPEAPEDFATFEENAVSKAKFYGEKSGMKTIAEDSGIAVAELGGWPGVKSARIMPTDESRNAEVIRRLKGKSGEDRGAAFISVAAYFDPATGESQVFHGLCTGMILEKPKGENGFGYDPIFYHPGYGKSFGECTPEEKNFVSHRGKSFRGLAEWLRGSE